MKNEIPDESGYYWVRMFSVRNKPSLVFLNKQGVVLMFGTRELYSSYEDVKEWLGPVKDLEE